MKKKTKEKNVDRVVRRYCDVAMANKKGYRPCDKVCRTCHASIEVLESGERRHCVPK